MSQTTEIQSKHAIATSAQAQSLFRPSLAQQIPLWAHGSCCTGSLDNARSRTNVARFGIPIAGGFDPGQRFDGFRTMFDLGTAIAGSQAYLGGQILLGRDDALQQAHWTRLEHRA